VARFNNGHRKSGGLAEVLSVDAEVERHLFRQAHPVLRHVRWTFRGPDDSVASADATGSRLVEPFLGLLGVDLAAAAD